MLCLSVNITKATEDFRVGVQRIGAQMSAYVEKTTPTLSVVNATCSLIRERLKASVSIVCTLSEAKKWLEVSPLEVQWITDDMGVYYDVVSNVEWIITTD